MSCTSRRRRRLVFSFLLSRQRGFPAGLFEDKIDNVSEGRPYEGAYEYRLPVWKALLGV